MIRDFFAHVHFERQCLSKKFARAIESAGGIVRKNLSHDSSKLFYLIYASIIQHSFVIRMNKK